MIGAGGTIATDVSFITRVSVGPLAQDAQQSVNTGAQLGPTIAGEVLQHVRPCLNYPESSSAGCDDGDSDQGWKLANETLLTDTHFQKILDIFLQVSPGFSNVENCS